MTNSVWLIKIPKNGIFILILSFHKDNKKRPQMTERIQSFNSPLLFHDGADDGNRTRVISLEG